MAVLSKFEATVIVDGEKATEYDAEEADQGKNTVVKYIESVTDAKFYINCAIHPVFRRTCPSISFTVDIDGQKMSSRLITEANFPKAKGDNPANARVDRVWSRTNDQWTCHGFKFSEVVFAQPGENGKNTKVFSQGGTITVKVRRYRPLGSVLKPTSSAVFAKEGEVSEKSAKGQAISHTTSLDSGIQTKKRPGREIRGKWLDSHPLAIFVFKYRSKKALQDLMVLTRSPSPPPPVEEKQIDDLTMDEMRELISRQRAETQAKVKREREEELISADSRRPDKRQNIQSEDEVECTFTRSLREAAAKPIDLTDE